MPAAHTAYTARTGSLVAALLVAMLPWLPLPLYAQEVCAGVAAEPVLQIVNAARLSSRPSPRQHWPARRAPTASPCG